MLEDTIIHVLSRATISPARMDVVQKDPSAEKL